MEKPDWSYNKIADEVGSTKRYVQEIANDERHRGRALPIRKPGRKPAPRPTAPATTPLEDAARGRDAMTETSPFDVVRMKNDEPTPTEPTRDAGPDWRCGACGTEGNGPAKYCPGCGGEFA